MDGPRHDQLTVTNLALTFRLIPETIILISGCGTVANPKEGAFVDVDSQYTWTVEDDRSTINSSLAKPYSAAGTKPAERWKPQSFPLHDQQVSP